MHTRRKDYHTFNGDGLDIDRSSYVSISNCRIDTSDDCITLRASGAHLLANPKDCAWVTVSACNLSSSCNGIRIGVGEGRIHDAVFSNITISDTKTAFNIVGAYEKNGRGTDIDGILIKDIRVDSKELIRIHHMHSKACTIKDIIFDSISGSAPESSHIWAREAAPFKGIVLRNIDVPAQFECVNAEVKVEGGSMSEKALSADEAAERRNNIENGKHLLY